MVLTSGVPQGHDRCLRHVRSRRCSVDQRRWLASCSSRRFNDSSRWPASPSLPSAVRRWYSSRSRAASEMSASVCAGVVVDGAACVVARSPTRGRSLRRARRRCAGPGRRRVAEQRRQRRLERRTVAEPVLQRQHDQPQLGHRAALGLQIDRLGVQQRAPDRDDDQPAAPDLRALLVPQRELRRQLRDSDRCAPRPAAGRPPAGSSGKL